MEKNSVLVLIFESLCGAVCLGLGIYYACTDKTLQAVVFIAVGAVCVVTAVRTLLSIYKKKKKGKDDKNDSGKNK